MLTRLRTKTRRYELQLAPQQVEVVRGFSAPEIACLDRVNEKSDTVHASPSVPDREPYKSLLIGCRIGHPEIHTGIHFHVFPDSIYESNIDASYPVPGLLWVEQTVKFHISRKWADDVMTDRN